MNSHPKKKCGAKVWFRVLRRVICKVQFDNELASSKLIGMFNDNLVVELVKLNNFL